MSTKEGGVSQACWECTAPANHACQKCGKPVCDTHCKRVFVMGKHIAKAALFGAVASTPSKDQVEQIVCRICAKQLSRKDWIIVLLLVIPVALLALFVLFGGALVRLFLPPK